MLLNSQVKVLTYTQTGGELQMWKTDHQILLTFSCSYCCKSRSHHSGTQPNLYFPQTSLLSKQVRKDCKKRKMQETQEEGLMLNTNGLLTDLILVPGIQWVKHHRLKANVYIFLTFTIINIQHNNFTQQINWGLTFRACFYLIFIQ